MHVEPSGGGLKVKRELEDGWFQHVEMPLPALLTIQSGGNKLRYATLMGIKKAKTKELKTVDASAAATAPSIALERVYLPEKQKKTEMLSGTPDEIANKIIEKLKFEVRVI
jgi:electron transfer flavoprotein beta subunit